MLIGTIKIPDFWKDFKIVETVSGAFTGQITIDDPEQTNMFNETDRNLLRDYTKEQIELALSIKIGKYNKDRKTTEIE